MATSTKTKKTAPRSLTPDEQAVKDLQQAKKRAAGKEPAGGWATEEEVRHFARIRNQSN